jgi:single-stranded DNA-binding protein
MSFICQEGKLTECIVKKVGDQRVTKITIACYNGKREKSGGPAYYNIDFWNVPAERRRELKTWVGEARICVVGQLRQEKWKQDGKTRVSFKIMPRSPESFFRVPDPVDYSTDDDDDDDDTPRRNKKGSKKGFSKKGFKKNRRPARSRREEEDEEENDVNEDEDTDGDDDDDDDDDRFYK